MLTRGPMPAPTLSIVIPAFNEEGRLAPTVRGAVACVRARGADAEIIVVDDGSRDGTSALVQRLAAELPPAIYQTWIKPLVARIDETAEGLRLVLRAPDATTREKRRTRSEDSPRSRPIRSER